MVLAFERGHWPKQRLDYCSGGYAGQCLVARGHSQYCRLGVQWEQLLAFAVKGLGMWTAFAGNLGTLCFLRCAAVGVGVEYWDDTLLVGKPG